MKLQVSVDLLSTSDALNLLHDVHQHVDVIEAGTPLIKKEGLAVVEAFKKAYPGKIIFADMKTMDAGELEADLAFAAGADIMTVLALANDGTIAGAVLSARKHGKQVSADMIGVKDLAARAHEVEKLGVNMVEFHFGLDQQAHGHFSIEDIRKLRAAIKIPLSVAGGVNLDTISSLRLAGVETAAVGGAIYHATQPGDAALALRKKIDEAAV